MKKKVIPVLAAIIFIVIVAAVSMIGRIAEKYTPTKEVMDAKEYFQITSDDEIAIIVQDELVAAKGLKSDDQIYLDVQLVSSYLNERFYWDSKENILVYTTPTDILQIPADSNEYTISGSKEKESYNVVKTSSSATYIAADFVKKYTDMDITLLENPNRVVITNDFTNIQQANVKSSDSIRYQGGVKSPILTSAPKGSTVTVLEAMDSWTKVLSADGYIGYIPNKSLGETTQVAMDRDFTPPEYTSIKKDYKINLVWHQITSEDANYNLSSDIANMTGVNTISPTWFSISDNEGNISSLASESYVATAHESNLEVWALVDNFSESIDTAAVLNTTSSRTTLSDKLIAAALEYKLDGINIDFETIPENAAAGYIQFIREMSVKCRKNNLVLSTDVPVPMPYTAHYNRREQGVVADYVIMMGYDEHYDGSEAGSVASLSFEKDGIENSLAEGVPADKLISAIPFYTRLWTTASDGTVTSSALGMDSADQILTDYNVESNWSEETSQDYAEFEDGNGAKCQIWLENETSIEEKMKLIEQNNLGGVAAWKLGLERSSIWEVISKYVN